MKYLSFDIEATGLEEDARIIEFAMVPFCTEDKSLNNDLAKHFYIHCPSFEELEPHLNPWVRENNKELIIKANAEGITLAEFKTQMEQYLESSEVKNYFGQERIVLFGKSISAIDLPFLNRDLGWEWMNKYFHHRNLDLSCVLLSQVDLGNLASGMESGSKIMEYFQMGEVAHTALEDAVNTAQMYLKLLKKFSPSKEG
ncbi:MAG: hypothetical protein CME65_06275 [Halobacteriovoraceae bacterium]|nr:hypothetical protein [Halobacteriovoraceae bacterium]|tara:strand:+ start:13668 stop:14264 length:597 start_codon:yes stop_codon:yes gene_type:complete